MNILNRITPYFKGEGSRPLLQNIADYGTAAALGTVGQQAMNIVSPGADPNPLLSGALAAPVLTLGGRTLRGAINPASIQRDAWAAARQTTNPYEQAALVGSLGGVLGGGLTNAQNTAFGGTDIDPNIAASIFAGIAPIASSLINKKKNIASTNPTPKPNSKTRSSDSPGFGYTGEGYSDLFNELEDIKRKFYNNNEYE